jgi:phosphoribosylglycinamide formyltransferase-1
MKKISIVVLISGRGSNLKAIIDAANPLINISAVISNRPDAAGLIYAQQAGITTEVLDHKNFATRLEFDTALQQCIDKYKPQLVVLAGFMRILSSEFVKHYKGRLINIHPSLLPKFKGLNTHKRAIEAGEKEHGATVHFVTEDLDSGPIILQARVPILADDTEESLAARVLQEEHKIYPEAIQLFAEGKLQT